MTDTSPDNVRAALLLTNRLVRLDAKPLTASEFWQLTERVRPGSLAAMSAPEIAEAADVDDEMSIRLRHLLDAATALGFEQERLSDGGVELVSALDERFPVALRERLGAACPPFLLVAGPIEQLGRASLGVVGSRDADDDALVIARRSAELAVEHGWPVVSGLARGVDQAAMMAALDVGGGAVGIPAEGILRAARNSAVRRGVHAGALCIASPYAPDAPFRAGSAIGRNKIVYALSSVTFVVAADEGTGGTWSGAKEALDRRFGVVAAWTGPGAKPGNQALVRKGAAAIGDPARLFEMSTDLPEPPRQDPLF